MKSNFYFFMAHVFIHLRYHFTNLSTKCDAFYKICRVRAIASSNASIDVKLELLNEKI